MKNIRKILYICALLTLCTMSVINAGVVSAISQGDVNSITGYTPFYDPNASSCSDNSVVPAGTLPTIIPEPYNGAFTQGANNHKVAPALVAAIFTEENFTHTPTSQLASTWASFVKTHTDPNSGWPTSSAGASGPFQFLPSTFTGLGYNIGDINNLVKAADAAADYLASNGGTVDKPPSSWQGAIFQYNHAQWYVDAVMGYYNFYSTGSSSTAAQPGAATATSGCAGALSVDCSNGKVSSAGSTTSSTDVGSTAACIAENELALWRANKMTPGFRQCTDQSATSTCNSYAKYTQNSEELWCADFVSWVYHIANYPIGTGSTWRVPAVISISGIGNQQQKWHFHPPGSYQPKVGDLVIHNTSQHVNMVIAVQGNEITMIGGDQAGTSFPDGSSVSEYTDSRTAGDITGYVSPSN